LACLVQVGSTRIGSFQPVRRRVRTKESPKGLGQFVISPPALALEALDVLAGLLGLLAVPTAFFAGLLEQLVQARPCGGHFLRALLRRLLVGLRSLPVLFRTGDLSFPPALFVLEVAGSQILAAMPADLGSLELVELLQLQPGLFKQGAGPRGLF